MDHGEETVELALPAGVVRTRRPRVLDIGGGSGTEAVPLALAGARVTVVDRSIDALAMLQRRATEAGVADRVVGVQGDADKLSELFAGESFNVVLLHRVLELVEDPADVLDQLRMVAEEGALVSIVVPGRYAAVADHLRAGRLAEAVAVLSAVTGSSGPQDPVRRRFTIEGLLPTLAQYGLIPITAVGTAVHRGLGADTAALRQTISSGPSSQIATQLAVLQQDPVLRELAGELVLLARWTAGTDQAAGADETAGTDPSVHTAPPIETDRG